MNASDLNSAKLHIPKMRIRNEEMPGWWKVEMTFLGLFMYDKNCRRHIVFQSALY